MADEKNTNNLDEVIGKIKEELDANTENLNSEKDESVDDGKNEKFSFADAGAKAGAAVDSAAEKGSQFARETRDKVRDGLMDHGIDTEKLASKLAEDAGVAAAAIQDAAGSFIDKVKAKLDEVNIGTEGEDGASEEADDVIEADVVEDAADADENAEAADTDETEPAEEDDEAEAAEPEPEPESEDGADGAADDEETADDGNETAEDEE